MAPLVVLVRTFGWIGHFPRCAFAAVEPAAAIASRSAGEAVLHFELIKDQIELQQRARTFVDTEVMPHYKSWPITTAEYSPELTAHLKQKLADYRLIKLLVPKNFGG